MALVSAPRLVVREVAIEPDEIIEYRRARCTTPVRTGFDLLRDPAESDVEVEPIVTALCADDPGLRADLRRRLEHSTRMPHRGLALRRLDRVEAMLEHDRLQEGRGVSRR